MILLDNRYFKDEKKHPEHSLLGEEQWKWLETVLHAHSDSQLYLIGSGIRILAPDAPMGEDWFAYPAERKRLFRTLAQAKLEGTAVLLSGDVHFAEFSCAEVDGDLGYPLFEMTTSGLTHAWGETGVFRFTPKLVSWLSRGLMRVFPSRYQLRIDNQEPRNTNYHGRYYYPLINFGLIHIDWEKKLIHLEIHGVAGEDNPVMRHTISLDKHNIHHGIATECLQDDDRRSYWSKQLARSMTFGVVSFFMLGVVCVGIFAHQLATRFLMKNKED